MGSAKFVQFFTEFIAQEDYPRCMGTKYYTRFLLQTVDQDSVDEYSGVVELHSARQAVMDTAEIEKLLAQSFDLDTSDQIRLLNWSPLH